MKKLMLILLTLGTCTAMAQNGSNGYYGGSNSNNYNTYTGVSTYNDPNYGSNAYYNGGGGNSRIRWEVSTCGTFRWRIEENYGWANGSYCWTPVYRTRVYHNHTCYNGCGHPMGGYAYAGGGWSNTCGPRPAYCGPRGGGYYTHGHGGHGHGHGHGHGNGHGHGHGGHGHGHHR